MMTLRCYFCSTGRSFGLLLAEVFERWCRATTLSAILRRVQIKCTLPTHGLFPSRLLHCSRGPRGMSNGLLDVEGVPSRKAVTMWLNPQKGLSPHSIASAVKTSRTWKTYSLRADELIWHSKPPSPKRYLLPPFSLEALLNWKGTGFEFHQRIELFPGVKKAIIRKGKTCCKIGRTQKRLRFSELRNKSALEVAKIRW